MKILRENKRTERDEILERRKELEKKLYLSEIILKEKPDFSNKNLILAPVGSGKSHLIEKVLIPKGYSKKILYLVSNTALKDSVCPPSSEDREELARNGQSEKFYTTKNKETFGNKSYKVHVMTYFEFGEKIFSPNQTFTEDVDLIFCDEIHSLPVYYSYDKSMTLMRVMMWLLEPRPSKRIYFFTATKDKVDEFEKKNPGFFNKVKVFDYMNYPNIRKYIARSTYYITNLDQLKPHLKAKKEYFDYTNSKILSYTRKIEDQKKIKRIAEEEGYKPIILWSINNDDEMDEEQLKVRSVVLKTGLIPEPYNFLIINSSMQEGWNLRDPLVELAILNTTDKTEQIQSLGRIRKDIELVIKRDEMRNTLEENIELEEFYLNRELSTEERSLLCEELNILDQKGRLRKWNSVKIFLKNSGYEIEEKFSTASGKKARVGIIKKKENQN